MGKRWQREALLRSKNARCAALLLAGLLLAFLLLPLAAVNAYAAGPAHTETLVIGPYIVQVTLAQYPPETDQADAVTVTPEDGQLRLAGSLALLPGLGTDAEPLRAALVPAGQSSALVGSVRLPVRGAWQIEVQLTGPEGPGRASFPIVVAAPGAIPLWLGWLIGATPLLGIVWLIWHQCRYRRTLLVQQGH